MEFVRPFFWGRVFGDMRITDYIIFIYCVSFVSVYSQSCLDHWQQDSCFSFSSMIYLQCPKSEALRSLRGDGLTLLLRNLVWGLVMGDQQSKNHRCQYSVMVVHFPWRMPQRGYHHALGTSHFDDRSCHTIRTLW